jgi:hypothetical protein
MARGRGSTEACWEHGEVFVLGAGPSTTEDTLHQKGDRIMAKFDVGQEVTWGDSTLPEWGEILLIFGHRDILKELTQLYVIQDSNGDFLVLKEADLGGEHDA